jgi:hypothetical protein
MTPAQRYRSDARRSTVVAAATPVIARRSMTPTAITRQAMLAHRGSASAENHPDGGLIVRLELPIGA